MPDAEGEMWVDGFELHGKGIVRTEEKCSECSKLIVAKINFDVNGNHRIACPHCGHLHCRVIKDGKMTSDRFDHKQEWIDAPTEGMWSNETLDVKTSSAHQHIRDRFLSSKGVT